MTKKSTKALRNLLHLYNILYDIEKQLITDDEKEQYSKKFEKVIAGLNRQHRNIWRFFIWKIPFEVVLYSKEENLSPRLVNRFLKALRFSIEKNFVDMIKFASSDKEPPSYKMIYPTFFENPVKLLSSFTFIKGKRKVLLVAAHSEPPLSDKYTGEVAELVARKTNSYALISNISRIYVDYNRFNSRLTPFRRIIDKLVFSRKINLIIDLHGNKSDESMDVEIGIRAGLTSKMDIIRKMVTFFEKHGLSVKINSTKFYGGDIIAYHTFPPYVNGVQLEINQRARKEKVSKIIKSLTEFIEKHGGKNAKR